MATSRLYLLVPAALAVVAMTGCAPPGTTVSAATPPKAKPVGYVTPTEGDVAKTMTQPGSLQGIEEATLFAKTAGYVKKMLVDKGDRVRAGQLLAVIESPELGHQEQQALAGLEQSRASALGAEASKNRAQADVAQGAANVERARADARQAASAVDRYRADLARTEATLPRLQSLAQEAASAVQQADEEQKEAEADVLQRQQQEKAAEATVQARQSTVAKAQSDLKLQKITYDRLKKIQDEDKGLIPGQQVDEARSRMEVAQGEVAAATHNLDAARETAAAAKQQVESAKRHAAAAGKKVETARSRQKAAEQAVEVARKDIDSAKQQVKVAESARQSSESQISVAESGRKALASQVKVADAQLAAARMQTRGSASALGAAKDLAGYTQIRAPFDGVVTERLADTGAFVQNAGANQAAARGIVKVVRDQSLRVMIPVPEADLPFIRKGQAATVTLDAYPKQPIQGVVTRFSAAVDPKSRTMLTEVDLPNKAGGLRAGMYARVTLTLDTHRNALSIPSEAIMGKEDDRFVYTVEGGHAKKTPVKVGVDDGKSAEVVEGLNKGAQVVLVGRDTLVDGAAVKAEPAPAPAAKK